MTQPQWTEFAIRFDCGEDCLVGVVSRPAGSCETPTLGAVIVVGGPQYRVGSHRQFVQWARSLATGGVTTLRFDVRGMGDSTGDLRSFESLGADIGAAIDALLAAAPSVRKVVLCGLCDGASAVLLYLNEFADTRVVGAQLLNPWARSAQTLAQTQVKHYYLDRLRSRSFWLKLLRGQVTLQAARSLASNLRVARSKPEPGQGPGFHTRMREAFSRWSGGVLLVLSGEDLTAREFTEYCAGDAAWTAILASSRVQHLKLPDADHTLSAPADMLTLQYESLRWIRAVGGAVNA